MKLLTLALRFSVVLICLCIVWIFANSPQRHEDTKEISVRSISKDITLWLAICNLIAAAVVFVLWMWVVFGGAK